MCPATLFYYDYNSSIWRFQVTKGLLLNFIIRNTSLNFSATKYSIIQVENWAWPCNSVWLDVQLWPNILIKCLTLEFEVIKKQYRPVFLSHRALLCNSQEGAWDATQYFICPHQLTVQHKWEPLLHLCRDQCYRTVPGSPNMLLVLILISVLCKLTGPSQNRGIYDLIYFRNALRILCCIL